MSEPDFVTDWKIPRSSQPRSEEFGFDLDEVLASVLAVSTIVPTDAFTASTLGTERSGNAVLIGDGLFLTIGYLITEASSVWLTLNDGRVVPGDVTGYDQETGFGLVQALERIDKTALPLGSSAGAKVGDRVLVGGGGGRSRSVSAQISAKQEFAGYWEYLLEEAIFTGPAHPHWGGTAVINEAGELLGIGSLQLQQERGGGRVENLNMIVPIDLLKPVLPEILASGRPNRPPRPWLGLYATEIDDRVVVAGLADRGPAEQAGLQVGDILVAVAGTDVEDLAGLYRRVWSLGQAGIEVPLRVARSGRALEVLVKSTDRNRLLKRRVLH